MTVSVSIEDGGASDAASTRAGHSEVMQWRKKRKSQSRQPHPMRGRTGLFEGRSVVNGEPEPAEPGTAMKEGRESWAFSFHQSNFGGLPEIPGQLDRINNHADKLSPSGEPNWYTRLEARSDTSARIRTCFFLQFHSNSSR